MKTRFETATLELQENDAMMRELTLSEMDEVTGGTGYADGTAAATSGKKSSLSANFSGYLDTSATAESYAEVKPN